MWKRWRLFLGSMIPQIAMLSMLGCASMFGRGAASTIPEKAHGFPAVWDSISGLGVLNWGGGVLILVGLAGFALAFTPIHLFESKAAPMWCVIAGVASIVLYNILDEFMWLVYVVLGIGAVFAAVTYWPAVKASVVKVGEVLFHKDLDKSGGVGDSPKFG